MTKTDQDFYRAHQIGERRTVRQGSHQVTQVFGRDGWWNIKVEPAR